MAAALEFYFDFSSPYGYFAAIKIEGLAARHGRPVTWKPILLGAVFKISGGQPLPTLPMKGPYALRDILRSARFYGIEYRAPSKFPLATQAPARAFYWANQSDPALAKTLAQALYRAYFVDDRDISSPEITADVAAALGLEREAVLAALNDPAVKDRLKNEVDAAIKLGVFGSPYIVVDGEPFWGIDRFDQLERWLARGPF
ncbi:MAG TPA: 2-hydroxychromene-2-carboxylate isomerase [Burkholderiales bacterium]|jgi:2-hydroxychromene-2-carboxylate isomerase|nr:2-hydroxychromene-2-carboxylate isomerase [Burkholderiales bacterium]